MFLMEPVMKVAPVRIKLTLDTTMSVAPETIAEGTPKALPRSEKVVRSDAVAILWRTEEADAVRSTDHASVADIAAGSDPAEALAAKLVTRAMNFET
jgi:hypothetical protein